MGNFIVYKKWGRCSGINFWSFMIRKFLILIFIFLISCAEEREDLYSVNNKLAVRDIYKTTDIRVLKGGYDVFVEKTDSLLDKIERNLYVFDFGTNNSPYFDGSIPVSVSNESIYHRWLNNLNTTSADQNGINPLFTDFIMGDAGNELLFIIPEGDYELTFISGLNESDVLPFEVSINGVNYKIYDRRFQTFASMRGYYAFNTISNIHAGKDGLRLFFHNGWLINAIIIKSIQNYEVRKYINLPVRFSYTSDFYNLLGRDNAIKWSKKFGYNYEQNWDYLVARSGEILNIAGLSDADPLTKLKYIAFYIDKMTRETCCEVPESEILDSPVDILDPDGYKKGSCFGMARLVGVLANSYGIPARLVGYFIDSDYADFPSLFPQISSPLFVVRNASIYSTFAIGGYNHTEVEIFYNGKWRLITNYFYEGHLAEYSAIEVVNNKQINTVKRRFYDNVQDIMYINLFLSNINRQADYCALPYSVAFYDLNTAASLYPENNEWTFKSDNHITSINSIRIGRYWGIVSRLLLGYDTVKRIGRKYFVPDMKADESLVLNLLITQTNKNPEENLNIYVNDKKIDYSVIDRVKNIDFQKRQGGIYQFRVKIDDKYIVRNRINAFDIEIKDPSSKVEIVIGKNDSRISDLSNYSMDYCNNYDMMFSQESYYYAGNNKYALYNNPLLFLEIVK